MLVDEIKITIKAGDGGEGRVSFGKRLNSGPDGGNGGDGGDVYVKASTDLTLLKKYASLHSIEAEDGEMGGRKKMSGKRGEDKTIVFPVGTHFKDFDTGEDFELSEKNQQILLCDGGKGGIGNFDLRSSVNTTPKKTIPATKGQSRNLKIILKFIADYGLIGLPSAGKSSLLNELTNAKAKTAQYHFTTLSPNLGVLPDEKIIADIPGLIEGASKGKGLGHKFLKHIQKVSLLLHCIAADSKDHLEDYKVIRKELKDYDISLLDKSEIILITKSDLIDQSEFEKIKSKFKDKKIIKTSIYDLESIEELIKLLQSSE